MNTNDMVTLILDSYKAFAKGNKTFFENNLTDDFTFSAPPDPLITRAEYFERWSESSAKNQQPVIKRILAQGMKSLLLTNYPTVMAPKAAIPKFILFQKEKLSEPKSIGVGISKNRR